MAGKRTATSDLNADNWNEEDESEEAGTFQKASDDVLSKRVVKAAKRRLPQNEDGTTAKSAFSTFSGFKTTTANSASPFSFLAKSNSDVSPVTSTNTSSFIPNKTPTTNGSVKISENGISATSTTSSPSKLKETTTTTTTNSSEKETTSPKKPSEYYAKLKGLNQSVAKWIKTHVDANPVCILTPIFRDYEKYLKEIESKHGKEVETPKDSEKKTEIKPEVKSDEKTETSSLSVEKKPESFIFRTTPAQSPPESTSWSAEKSLFGGMGAPAKSIFASTDKLDSNRSPFSATSTFASDKNPFLRKSPTPESKKDESSSSKCDDKTLTSSSSSKSDDKTSANQSLSQTAIITSTFSFGQSSSSSTASAGFSFGTGKPFTFGAAAVKPAETEQKPGNTEEKEKEDEDDEPPKPDFKPVSEEGSIYEQKCKVFVKKDSGYSDRGVGTLFLKPAPNDKMQLIVRAVNSLGNLLVNFLLTESIPIKRLNATNIMLVCMPTSEPPPVPTLFRVKTSEEADALFEALEKHKK